jgi:hypothetical protein
LILRLLLTSFGARLEKPVTAVAVESSRRPDLPNLGRRAVERGLGERGERKTGSDASWEVRADDCKGLDGCERVSGFGVERESPKGGLSDRCALASSTRNGY